MRNHRITLATSALGFFLGALPIYAQDPQQPQEKPAEKSTEKPAEKPADNPAQKPAEKPAADPAPWYSPSRYDPRKLLKRNAKSANEQLAEDGNLEQRLTTQLQAQGFLAPDKDLQDACSDFRDLASCVAVLRLSKTLQIEFSCLKWDVTGMKPRPVADSCAGPSMGKAMRMEKAVELLKPDSNAVLEARNALQKAHNDIKDATS